MLCVAWYVHSQLPDSCAHFLSMLPAVAQSDYTVAYRHTVKWPEEISELRDAFKEDEDKLAGTWMVASYKALVS